VAERGKLVLVTGANGFVGSHVAEALLARGERVRCMVRQTSDLSAIHQLPVEWAYADLREPADLRRACQGVDAIVHCAAVTRALDEQTFFCVNAQAAQALALACLEVNPGVSRFLLVSSQAAVGPSRSSDDYLDESSPPQPTNWYGRSKWTAEQRLLDLADRLPLTIVRPSAVFGPRDRDFLVYFELVARGLSLRLGRRERRVSLIYVRDLAQLILLALHDQASVGQTYFGCGCVSSYTEFSEAIAQSLDKHPLAITVPEFVLAPIALWSGIQGKVTGRPALLNGQRVLDMKPAYWLCSGEKARRELGFAPRYDLGTAVRETVNWYRRNGWI
jgi:dihydroflavonol-4-reductase